MLVRNFNQPLITDLNVKRHVVAATKKLTFLKRFGHTCERTPCNKRESLIGLGNLTKLQSSIHFCSVVNLTAVLVALTYTYVGTCKGR